MIVPNPVLDAAFMREHGLRLIGHRIMQSVEENEANFKSSYGVLPATCAALWYDLSTSAIPDIQLDDNARIDHLFWTLHFLKVYPKGRNMRPIWQGCQKTIMAWTKYFLQKIALLKDEKL